MRCLAIVAVAALTLPGPAQAASEPLWREVAPENLVFLELAEGRIAIELNPRFAPKTVRQFRQLLEQRFYDGLGFYRVIDGFVAQGGDGSDLGRQSNIPLIEAEFEIEWSDDLRYAPVEREADMFADETGFIDGFAVGRDLEKNSAWLLHCPGVVAMARGEGRDSSRTDFYFVIGQAPRYLDRNLNVFGRVIGGMDVVQKIARGPAANNGIIENDTQMSRIRRAWLASAMSEDEELKGLVMDTQSDGFEHLLKDRRKRRQAWFQHRPPEVLDVCQVPVGSTITR
jgi:peptidylprolyl isomerase